MNWTDTLRERGWFHRLCMASVCLWGLDLSVTVRGDEPAKSSVQLLQYVPDHALAALHASPARMLQQSELSVLGDLPWLGTFPFPPSQVVEVLTVVALDPYHGEPVVGHALRFDPPMTEENVIEWLSHGALRDADSPLRRFTGNRAGPSLIAGTRLNPRMDLVFAGPDVVLASRVATMLDLMLAEKAGCPVTAVFDESSDDAQFRLAVDAGQVRDLRNGIHTAATDDPFLRALDALPRELGVALLELQFGVQSQQAAVRFFPRQDVTADDSLAAWLPTANAALGTLLHSAAQHLRDGLPPDEQVLLDQLLTSWQTALLTLQPTDAVPPTLQSRQLPSLSRAMRHVGTAMRPFALVARHTARWAQRQDHMHQVILTWHDYENKAGELPTDIRDAARRPLLSWRVRLLPALGDPELQKLYEEFHLDEPWDSAHNRTLIPRMPQMYRWSPALEPGLTRMLSVRGAGCVLPGPTRYRDITDGVSNTVGLVEGASPAIWTQPADLEFTGAGTPAQLYFDPVRQRAMVCFLDGKVSSYGPSDEDIYRRLFNIGDGQTIPWREIEGASPPEPPDLAEPTFWELTASLSQLSLAGSPTQQELALRRIAASRLRMNPDLTLLQQPALAALRKALLSDDALVAQLALQAYVQQQEAEAVDWELLRPAIERLSPQLRWSLQRQLVRFDHPEVLRLWLRETGVGRVAAERYVTEEFTPEAWTSVWSELSVANRRWLCELWSAFGGATQLSVLPHAFDDADVGTAARQACMAIQARLDAQDPTREARQYQLKQQRNRLWNQAQQELKQSQGQVAVDLVQQMLVIEEELFGPEHDEVLQTLAWLANQSTALGQRDAALQRLEDRQTRLAQKYGAADHRAREAALDVQLLTARSAFTAAQRQDAASAEAAMQRGLEELKADHWEDAQVAFELCRDLREKLFGPEHVQPIQAVRMLRQVAYKTKQFPRAIALGRRVYAADVAAVGPDHPVSVDDQAELAFLLRLNGEMLEARRMFADLLPRLERQEKQNVMLAVHRSWNANVPPEQLEDVLGHERDSLALLDALGEVNEAASLANSIGDRYALQGDRAAGRAWWFNSYWRGQSSNPLLNALTTYGDLASTYQQSGEIALELTCRDAMARVVEAAPQNFKPHFRALILTHLAGIQLSVGDVPQAERNLAQARAALGDDRNQPILVELLLHQAAVREQAGEWEAAAADADAAAATMRQLAPALAPTVLPRVAEVHLRGTHPERALAVIEPAAALIADQQTDAAHLVRAAWLRALSAAGQAETVEREWPRVMAAVRTSDDAVRDVQVWLSFARLALERGDEGAAQEFADRAVSLTRSEAAGPRQVAALTLAAEVHAAAGAPDALDLARQALAAAHAVADRAAYVLSPRQQLELSQTMRQALDAYVALAIHRPELSRELYAQIYRWKGATLVRERALQSLRHAEDVAPFYAQLAQVSRRMASSGAPRSASHIPASDPGVASSAQSADELAALQELLEAQLSAARLAYLDLQPPSTLADLQATLHTGEVLVDYFVYQGALVPNEPVARRLAATIVRAAGVPRVFDLGEFASVEAAVQEWRRTFGVGPEGVAAGRTLSQRLWQPLAEEVGSAATVLISPDGALGRLPFAALPVSDRELLLERHRLVSLPVPQLAAESAAVAQATEIDVLALGDVRYDAGDVSPQPATPDASVSPLRSLRGDQSFLPLPGTARELEQLQSLAAQAKTAVNVHVLRDLAATEAEFRKRAPQSAQLHLATHGFFADASAVTAEAGSDGTTRRVFRTGLLSGLALAGANTPQNTAEDDGILTAEELAVLDLNRVTLAVLSACETGLGQEAGGEGLLGMQRAFQVAGVRSTIASLWSVDDHATQTLMTRFYQHLWQDELPPAEALRQAQLWMLQHPQDVWQADPAGGVRGDRRLAPTPGAAATDRLPPQFWAAFTISGTWLDEPHGPSDN